MRGKIKDKTFLGILTIPDICDTLITTYVKINNK